jgi:ComF family protein
MMRWPSQCAVCHDWATSRVCERCVARFAPAVARCRRCALPSVAPLCGECMRVPPPYEAAVAAVDYRFPWDGLIARFKFQQALDLAPMFASLLEQALRHADTPQPTLVLPVPLGRERLRERGYNQAWELARRLGRRLGCESDARFLLRTVDTPHQLSLPRDKRAANVRGSFALDARHAARLRGRSIALVDDVMTTGATVAEAARTLLGAGAASVQLWIAARTPAPD